MAFRVHIKLLWLAVPFVGIGMTGGDDLVKTKISEGITVVLPAELKAMTPEDLAQRFPSVRAPLGAFTDADRLIDFSVNVSATQWPDENLDIARKFFKAGIYHLYDRIELIDEGIHEVHKKKFIYFEFISRLNSVKLMEGTQPAILHYTFIQYLVEPGRALVFSFSCPKDQQERWQPRAQAIMKSVKMK